MPQTYNFVGDKELDIGYIEGNKIASLSSSILKFTNKAKKLAEEYPDQVKLYTNEDGTIYMTFPVDWIRFPKPKTTRILTEEDKQKLAERMENARNQKKGNNQ